MADERGPASGTERDAWPSAPSRESPASAQASSAPSLRSSRIVLMGASLVLRDDVVRADLTFADGVIVGIGDAPADGRRIDCDGCLVLPGFVDLHTDNIERHVEPRPRQFRSPERAVLAHDAELASCGVTTAFDAVALGGSPAGSQRRELAPHVVAALARARGEQVLRIDHRLHLRCELSDAGLPAIIAAVVERLGAGLGADGAPGQPGIVSLMNHTPGQRQWRNLDKFRTYYLGRYGLSEAELSALIARRQQDENTVVPINRRHAVALAARTGARLASHDDTEPRDVDDAIAAGCIVSEFPTTAVAAAHAAAQGLAVVAGAPNLVSGASHSGNVAAADLARDGHLQVLASDYRPSSLLEAAFVLHQQFGWTLPASVRTLSFTPARLLGLDDRGEIAVGCRADVIVVSRTGLGPAIRETWARGVRVF